MKVADLDITHPAYQPDTLEDYRQLYEGGDDWDPKRWIPSRPREDAQDYKRRTEAATYTNDAAHLVDLLPAMLFSDPARLDDAPGGDFWEAWPSDVDRKGSDLSAYLEDGLSDALVTSAAYTLVDLPASDATPTSRLEQERRGGLQPYLVSYDANDLIRWGEDDRGRLSWCVFRVDYQRDKFGSAPERVRRWTYVDDVSIMVYEAPIPNGESAPDPKAEAIEVSHTEHGRGRLPVARLWMPPGLHAMRQLRDPLVRLLRARNAADWSCDQACYAAWAVMMDGDVNDLAASDGYVLKFPKDTKIQRMGTDAATHEVARNQIKDAREDVFRIMRAMFEARSADENLRQSGESKARDWQAREVSLASYDQRVRTYAKEIVSLVANARGEVMPESSVRIGGLSSWRQLDEETLIALLDAALPHIDKSPTASREAAMAVFRRIFDNPDRLAAIEEEVVAWEPEPDPTFGVRRQPAPPAEPPDPDPEG